MAETKIGIKIEEETKDIKKICEPLLDSIKHEFAKGIEQIDVEEMKEAIDMLKDLYEAKKSIVEACYYVTIMEAMEKEEEEGKDGEEDGEEGRMYYRGQARSRTSGRYMRRGDGRRSNRGRRGYEEMMPMEDEEEYMRDMDRYSMGRMYYAGGGSGGSSGGSGGTGGQSSGGGSGGSSGGSGSGGSSGGTGGSRGYSEGGGESGGRSGGSSGGRRNYDGESGNQSSRSENARRGYEETKMMDDGSPESKKKAMESLEKYMKELGGDITDLVGKMDANEKSMLKQKLSVLAQKVQ